MNKKEIIVVIFLIIVTSLLLPPAFELGESLADTRDLRLERAFRGGSNFDEDVADAIEAGENLNEVLTQEMVIQEGLDQARRLATAELGGNAVAAEDAKKTLDDLRSLYVDLGGDLENFNSLVGTLAAKAWVDGELTVEEFRKIAEIIDEARSKEEELMDTNDRA